MTADLSTTIGDIPLTTAVYNASGPRTGSSAAMAKIASSASGAVLAKSATVASQKGNDMPRTWHEDDGVASLNSEGLPNAILEGMAAGLPVVASDLEVCRELAAEGPFVRLFPVGDDEACLATVRALADDPVRGECYGVRCPAPKREEGERWWHGAPLQLAHELVGKEGAKGEADEGARGWRRALLTCLYSQHLVRQRGDPLSALSIELT